MQIIDDLVKKYSKLFSSLAVDNLNDIVKLDIIEKNYGWHSLPFEMRLRLEHYDIYDVFDGVGWNFKEILIDEDENTKIEYCKLLNKLYTKPFYYFVDGGEKSNISYATVRGVLKGLSPKKHIDDSKKMGINVFKFIRQFFEERQINYVVQDEKTIILYLNNKSYEFIIASWFEFSMQECTGETDFGSISLEFRSLADLLNKLEAVVLLIENNSLK